MYLRAEQRKREELAADGRGTERTNVSTPVASATEILTSAPGTTTTTVVPARPALDLIDAVALELPPARPIQRPRQAMMPAAILGAVAVIATLGVVLTLTPDATSEEPASAAAATPAASVQIARPSEAPTVESVPVATTTAPAPVIRSTPEARATRLPSSAAATVPAARVLDGQIRVTSTPSGARVTVDGIGWGQTPLTVSHLPFGTKTVRVTHDGYASREAIVRISADKPAGSVSIPMTRR